jgi:hypothetical protein
MQDSGCRRGISWQRKIGESLPLRRKKSTTFIFSVTNILGIEHILPLYAPSKRFRCVKEIETLVLLLTITDQTFASATHKKDGRIWIFSDG